MSVANNSLKLSFKIVKNSVKNMRNFPLYPTRKHFIPLLFHYTVSFCKLQGVKSGKSKKYYAFSSILSEHSFGFFVRPIKPFYFLSVSAPIMLFCKISLPFFEGSLFLLHSLFCCFSIFLFLLFTISVRSFILYFIVNIYVFLKNDVPGEATIMAFVFWHMLRQNFRNGRMCR